MSLLASARGNGAVVAAGGGVDDSRGPIFRGPRRNLWSVERREDLDPGLCCRHMESCGSGGGDSIWETPLSPSGPSQTAFRGLRSSRSPPPTVLTDRATQEGHRCSSGCAFFLF